MNYLDVLRPLFSHAAHLALRHGDPGGARAPDRVVGAAGDFEALLTRTRGRIAGHTSEFGRLAWFAASVWLADHAKAMPWMASSLSVPPPETASDEFYRNLESLLHPAREENLAQERLSTLEVYAACLELGYRGCGRYATCADAYLERCRGALYAARANEAGTQEPGGGKRFFSACCRTVAGWLTPPAITLLLYVLYRLLLSRQFVAVVG